MIMKHHLIKEIQQYVEENIGTFHKKRIAGVERLRLSRILKRKNPYLFKSKNVLTANEIIKSIVDAHISSSEEGIFGDWLEGLAVFVNNKVYKGWKSGINNIDLEFDLNGIRYIVNIKSGPNWGNSSQVAKMISDFVKAKKVLRTSNSGLNIVAVNGCCYGIDNKPDKGYYYKYCGQRFWEFISGEKDLYIDIIEPLGYKAKEKNEEFLEMYARILNRLTKEFIVDFCDDNGNILWDKLVVFNSGSTV